MSQLHTLAGQKSRTKGNNIEDLDILASYTFELLPLSPLKICDVPKS